MYNPNKVTELLKVRGIKNKQLLAYFGYNEKGGLLQSIQGDIRASKLEKIADFFGVPIDVFFDRDIETSGAGKSVLSMSSNDTYASKSIEREKLFQALLDEKDRRIALLEDMVELLKKQG